MKKSTDGRIGPWKYSAHFEVLDQAVWKRAGEVIYFVADSAKVLRLVGQSSVKLGGRWKLVPMHSVDKKLPLERRALFHTTSWPAIEIGLQGNERFPLTVSALFREELNTLCMAADGGLADTVKMPETHLQRLAFHVESWVCSLDHSPARLWNKHKVKS